MDEESGEEVGWGVQGGALDGWGNPGEAWVGVEEEPQDLELGEEAG